MTPAIETTGKPSAKQRADSHFNAFLHQAFTVEQLVFLDWTSDRKCDSPAGAFKYHWTTCDDIEVRLVQSARPPLEGTGIECRISRELHKAGTPDYVAEMLVRRKPAGDIERVYTVRVLHQGGPAIIYDTATGTIRMVGNRDTNQIGMEFLKKIAPELFEHCELTRDPQVVQKIIENLVFTGKIR